MYRKWIGGRVFCSRSQKPKWWINGFLFRLQCNTVETVFNTATAVRCCFSPIHNFYLKHLIKHINKVFCPISSFNFEIQILNDNMTRILSQCVCVVFLRRAQLPRRPYILFTLENFAIQYFLVFHPKYRLQSKIDRILLNYYLQNWAESQFQQSCTL